MIAIDCPTWPREFLDPQWKIWKIDCFTIADNGVLVKFDEQNHEFLTQAMNYVLDNNLSEQAWNVCNYCQIFDNSVNAKKRDDIIQSLV